MVAVLPVHGLMMRLSRPLVLWLAVLAIAFATGIYNARALQRRDGARAERLRVALEAAAKADAQLRVLEDSIAQLHAARARADSVAAAVQARSDRSRRSAEQAIADARRAAADTAATNAQLRTQIVALAFETERILADAAEERVAHGRQLAERDALIETQRAALETAKDGSAARDDAMDVLDAPKVPWWRRVLGGASRAGCAAGGGAIGALLGGAGGAAIGAAGGALVCQ